MIKIPTPKMPTEHELFKISSDWWGGFKGLTFFDIGKELYKHTIPFAIRKIPTSVVSPILEEKRAGDEFDNAIFILTDIISDCKKSLHIKCDEFFFKLITRSPKDINESLLFKDAVDVYRSITSSMRCFEDLCLLSHIGMEWMVIRPYLNINKVNEYRAFIENRKLKGVSRYRYDLDHLVSDSDVNIISKEIYKFCNSVLIPNIPAPTYSADLYFNNNKIILIEMNPYYTSDPCFFVSHDRISGFKISF